LINFNLLKIKKKKKNLLFAHSEQFVLDEHILQPGIEYEQMIHYPLAFISSLLQLSTHSEL